MMALLCKFDWYNDKSLCAFEAGRVQNLMVLCKQKAKEKKCYDNKLYREKRLLIS